MRVHAVLEFAGSVSQVDEGDVPREGPAIRAGRLYVDGRAVGSGAWVDSVDADHIRTDESTSVDVVIHATTVICVLDL